MFRLYLRLVIMHPCSSFALYFFLNNVSIVKCIKSTYAIPQLHSSSRFILFVSIVFFSLSKCSIQLIFPSSLKKKILPMAKHVYSICSKFDFGNVTIGVSDIENFGHFPSIHSSISITFGPRSLCQWVE